MGVVKHAVLQGNSGSVGCFIDDADSLAVRDILTAIGLGFLNGEIVKLTIATILTFFIIGKKCVARPLEGDKLIREGIMRPNVWKVTPSSE